MFVLQNSWSSLEEKMKIKLGTELWNQILNFLTYSLEIEYYKDMADPDPEVEADLRTRLGFLLERLSFLDGEETLE